MDENQRQSLLEAIYCSGAGFGNITSQQRSDAYSNLEQFKSYPGRMAACVEIIGCDTLQIPEAGNGAAVDITVPSKLYALGVIQEFLKVGYNSLNDIERGQLRTSIVRAAHQLIMASSVASVKPNDSARILAVKLASLLADLALREFPQRWQTFVSDLFSPVSSGGMWCEASANAGCNTIGVKIGLECLKLITEDCTDSDYNARVSQGSGYLLRPFVLYHTRDLISHYLIYTDLND